MEIDAQITINIEDPRSWAAVQARLGLLLEQVNRVVTQGVKIMAAADDLKAGIVRINTATNNISADIQRLKDKISTSMSPADVADVQSRLSVVADNLEKIAADPDNPDPTPTPEPEPTPEPPAA